VHSALIELYFQAKTQPSGHYHKVFPRKVPDNGHLLEQFARNAPHNFHNIQPPDHSVQI
jgi:hypothetical protein